MVKVTFSDRDASSGATKGQHDPPGAAETPAEQTRLKPARLQENRTQPKADSRLLIPTSRVRSLPGPFGKVPAKLPVPVGYAG